MTTDFLLILIRNGYQQQIARTIKYASDLNNKRVLEKFDIERLYWQRRNVDWGIITEDQINSDLINNIVWVRKAKSLLGFDDINIDIIEKVEFELRNEIKANNRIISKLTSDVDERFQLVKGTSLFIVRFLIANRIWEVNMFEPINNPKSIISLQNVNWLNFKKEKGEHNYGA